jgi:hypothetical protein
VDSPPEELWRRNGAGHGVVVYHERAVRAEMHVQFDAVGSKFNGSPEGGDRVFRAFAGGSPMGNDFGAVHPFKLTPGECRRLIGEIEWTWRAGRTMRPSMPR